MSSRWASAENDTATIQQKKRKKLERQQLREDRNRETLDSSSHLELAVDLEEEQSHEHQPQGDRQPPSKRQRTASPGPSRVTNGSQNEDSENHLLSFPRRTLGPSAPVNDYELLNAIEEGSYGKVSRAKRKTTGEIVALKKLKIENNSEGFPVTGLREIQTLRACSHINIVTLQEVVVGSSLSDIYIVMDFLEHDLKTLLDDISEPFLPSETKTLMLQITSAVSYLHSNFILHRDLKTSNLLLNNRGEIKLADFGMARYTGNPPPRLTQLVVTLWYRAPELLLGATEYSFEIDIWSIGCIFAELLTREPLFLGKNEVSQLSLIFDLLGKPTPTSWPEFRNLPNAKALHPLTSTSKHSPSKLTPAKFPYLTSSGLRLLSSLLSLNPTGRPTADQILQHPYFLEDPRPKAKEMFPTFPSKAGQEKRRRKRTPPAPVRGDAPKIDSAQAAGLFAAAVEDEERGGGFALRVG